MDDFCRKFEGGYCPRVDMTVPKSWCSAGCEYYGRKLPSMPKMAANFTGAVVRRVVDRRDRPADQQEACMEMCRACDRHIVKNGQDRCTHGRCGCFLAKKIKWASEMCPEGRWHVLNESTPQPKVHRAADREIFWNRLGKKMNLIDVYRGQAVFIVCNGPSFGQVDQSLLRRRGIVTFGMNNGAWGFRPNMCSLQDGPWKFMPSIWSDPGIMKFTHQNNRHKYFRPNLQVGDMPNVVYHKRGSHFDPKTWLDADYVDWGRKGSRCSLMAIIHICWLMGFRWMYLIGNDWKMESDQSYFFPQQTDQKARDHNNKIYNAQAEYMKDVRKLLELEGTYVYNCTEGSQLDAFEYMDLEFAVNRHVIESEESTEGAYAIKPSRENKRIFNGN